MSAPAIALQLQLFDGRRRVELDAPQGRVVVVGPSGAGKSTLLRAIAGIEPRARGRIAIDGQPWLDSDAGVCVPAPARAVGYVPQDARLFPHVRVRDNLLWAGRAEPGACGRVAAALGIEHLLDRMPRHLSGGERQRVALGRALLSRARLLALDEPFAALDRPLRRAVLAVVLDHLARERTALVLVTHDERELDGLDALVHAM
ncbi:MAG: ATP-binding cassette domain-containing protein [Nannocystaceae bacterium]|nr:ATP-binding cassette domain-containing protein [Nannocystaceae bacterium]